MRDAITYLNEHKEKLRNINSIPEIQYACLDFGVDYDTDKFTQTHFFSNEFLKLVSQLGIGIELSIYQPSDELID